MTTEIDEKAEKRAYWASHNPLEQNEEGMREDLFCAVCSQDFSTPNGIGGHLTSKKHLKKVAALTAKQDNGAPSSSSVTTQGQVMDLNPALAAQPEAQYTAANVPKVKLRLHFNEDWEQVSMLELFVPQYRDARDRESLAKKDKEGARDVLREVTEQLVGGYAEKNDGEIPDEVVVSLPFDTVTPKGMISEKVAVMGFVEGRESISADRLLELGVDPGVIEQAKMRSSGYWTLRDLKA